MKTKVGELIDCLFGEIDGLIIGKMTYILRENLVRNRYNGRKF